MQIYLDTANINEIKEAAATGLLDGLTTNPTLMAKQDKPFQQALADICKVVKGPVSAEVVGETCEVMIKEAKELVKIADNIVIKIPMMPEGMKAVKQLVAQGIKTNATLCFSLLQALTAAKAGSTYASVFVGRLDDAGHNGMEVIRQAKQAFVNYQFSTKLIVASIRHPLHVVESALIGADIATLPYAIYKQMFRHPLTDQGIKRFLEDWQKVPK